jgi:hypothetical protein
MEDKKNKPTPPPRVQFKIPEPSLMEGGEWLWVLVPIMATVYFLSISLMKVAHDREKHKTEQPK